MQVKLLRVLQEQEFEPVGSSRTVRVDVRVIAATNRDLQAEVAAGRFRSDLFYRLNVFPIHLPALRDRVEDIPLLAHFFAGRFSKQIGKAVSDIHPETMARLVSYSWPGNIRELQNVIERAVILARADVLEIGTEALQQARPDRKLSVAVAPHSTTPEPPPSTFEEMGRNHILSVLEKTNWQIEGDLGAARALDLHPNTLRSRMKKLGIVRPRV